MMIVFRWTLLLMFIGILAGAVLQSQRVSAGNSPEKSRVEYKVLEFKQAALSKRDDRRDNRMEDELNQHAAEGWRVVSHSSLVWEARAIADPQMMVHTVILVRDLGQ